MSVNETIGNGFNWQVTEWPYLVISDTGDVTVFNQPNTALWFTKSGTSYVPDFNVKQSLTLDTTAQVYRLIEQEGTVTEYDSDTGAFHRRVDPAGNDIQVTAVAPNGYNFTAVQRTFTAGRHTTVEEYQYHYDTASGDNLLTQVTLRRQVDGGSWTDVAQALYTYYEAGDTHGLEGCYRQCRPVSVQ